MADIFWSSIPNDEYTQRLQWKTDVIKGYAFEQRVRLRDAPREYFNFKYTMTQSEYVSSALAVANNPAQEIAMANWTVWDSGSFNNPNAIWNSSRIFSVGTRLVVHPAIDGDFAPFTDEIERIGTSPTGGRVYYLKTSDNARLNKRAIFSIEWVGRLSSGIQFDLSSNEVVNASCEWIGVKPATKWPLDPNVYQLIGPDPVLKNYHTADSEANHSYLREIDTLDNDIAQPFMRPKYAFKQSRYSFSLKLKVGVELEKFLGFIHYLRGRLKPFWLPLWGKNLSPIADIKKGTNIIRCQRILWKDRFAGNRICIWVKEGCEYKYKFIEIASVADTTFGSDLTTSETIGTDTNLSDIIQLAFMEYVRLDSDEVSIKYDNTGYATISLVAISIPRGI